MKSRDRLPFVLAVLSAMVASALVIVPAPAARADWASEVTLTWPAIAPVGSPLGVTVQGVGLTVPAQVTLRAAADEYDDDGSVLDTATLSPPDGAVTLPLANRPGTFGYRLVVVQTFVDPYDGALVEGVIADEYHEVIVEGLPSTITAHLPSGRIEQGARRVIAGRVSGQPHRLVQVQHQARNGTWVPLAETHARADGTFRVSAPTWWVATQRLRIYAPASDVDAPVGASGDGPVVVVHKGAVRGGRAARFLSGSSRTHWNPCRVLTYRINPRLTPHGLALRPMARRAFKQVSAATGLRFRFAGAASYVPFARHPGQAPSGTDFVLGWVSPKGSTVDWDSAAGYGGASYLGTEYFRGKVALDYSDVKRYRFMGRREWMIVLLHEVGHAIGLAHVGDRRQIMYPGAFNMAPRYGGGDLRGFAAIGADAGCPAEPLDPAATDPFARARHDVGRSVLLEP